MQTEPYPQTNQEDIDAYVEQLSPLEKIAMNIAKEELKSSFCIEKSIGFMQWLAKRQE